MGNITGEIQDINQSKFVFNPALTKVTFTDGEVAAVSPGIVRMLGIIPVGIDADAGTDITRLANGAASDIGGYRTLTATPALGLLVSRSAVAGTDVTTLIEEYATAHVDMSGTEINGSDTDWAVSAKRSAGAEVAVIVVEFFHRTSEGSGGDETLLATDETTALTTSWVTYTGTVNFTQTFLVGERLVTKYSVENRGEDT
jgi:hypothetical protein